MSTTTPEGVARILRRIDRLEAARRRVLRSLARCTPGSPLAAVLAEQRDELNEQLVHLRRAVASAVARGVKIWSRVDFRPGDFVHIRGLWYEVLRVNERSVTVPHVPPGMAGDVVRRSAGDPEWTWKAGYHDGISGRMSAGELESRQAGQGPRIHGA